MRAHETGAHCWCRPIELHDDEPAAPGEPHGPAGPTHHAALHRPEYEYQLEQTLQDAVTDWPKVVRAYDPVTKLERLTDEVEEAARRCRDAVLEHNRILAMTSAMRVLAAAARLYACATLDTRGGDVDRHGPTRRHG